MSTIHQWINDCGPVLVASDRPLVFTISTHINRWMVVFEADVPGILRGWCCYTICQARLDQLNSDLTFGASQACNMSSNYCKSTAL